MYDLLYGKDDAILYAESNSSSTRPTGKPKQGLVIDRRVPRVLDGLIRVLNLARRMVVSNDFNTCMGDGLTWKMRPSGEYVLAERS